MQVVKKDFEMHVMNRERNKIMICAGAPDAGFFFHPCDIE